MWAFLRETHISAISEFIPYLFLRDCATFNPISTCKLGTYFKKCHIFGRSWSQKGHYGPPVHIIGGWRNSFKPSSYMPRDYSYAMSNKHINGCDQKSEGISSKITKNCKILLSNATQWQGHDMGCDYLSILLGDEVVCQLWLIPNT